MWGARSLKAGREWPGRQGDPHSQPSRMGAAIASGEGEPGTPAAPHNSACVPAAGPLQSASGTALPWPGTHSAYLLLPRRASTWPSP